MAETTVRLDDAGEFTGATLTNAASEATLERVASALEAQQKGTGQKILGMHTSAVNANIKAQQGAATAGQAFTKTVNQINSAGQQLYNTFTSIIGLGIGTTFALIQTTGEGLLGFMKNGYMAFKETAEVGGSFNNSLIELRYAAARAAIPLDEFTDIIKNNSGLFAALGGSVTQGAERFSDLSKTFRDEFGTELLGAGYSLQQMNESLLNYLDIQNRTGKLDLKNTRSITSGTEAYMKELDQVTKLTGISRKQAEDAIKKAAIDPILNSMMKNAKDQAKAQANMAMLTQVGGEQALEMIKSMAARNPSEEARLLMSQTGASMEEAREILTGGIGSAQTLNKFRNYAKQLEAQGMLSGEYAETIAAYNPAMANLIQTMLQFRKMTDADLEKIQKEQKAREAITTVFGKIGQVLNDLYNKFLQRLVESQAFKTLQVKIEELAEAFTRNAPQIEKLFDDIISTFGNVIDNFIKNVDQNGVMSAIVSFFKDLFAGIKDKIFPEIGSLIKNLFKPSDQAKKQEAADILNKRLSPVEIENLNKARPGTVPTNAPVQEAKSGDFDIFEEMKAGISSLTSLLPSFENLGWWLGITGIGAAIGGTGLAFGLGSLGTAMQKLALPALELAGAVGITGLGLGAAFYGLSKAIDSGKEGLKTVQEFFEKLLGVETSKLVNIGVSLTSFSVSLSQMANAGFVSFISGGGLTTLTTSFEKLANIDYTKLNVSGDALKSLHDGMSLFTSGGILSSWNESISSWFGEDTIDNIVASIQKFNNIDVSKLGGLQPLTDLFQGIKLFSEANAAEIIPNVLSNLQNTINGIDINQEKLQNIVSAVGAIHTSFDTDLTSSTNNVKSFTDSIDKLVESLSALEEQLKKTPSGKSLEAGVTTQTSPTGIPPTISSEDLQKQLNMKFDQMIEILTQMKDNTKDTADTLNRRRNAM